VESQIDSARDVAPRLSIFRHSIAWVLVGLVLIVAVLAGCGSSGSDGHVVSSGAAPDPPTATDPTATSTVKADPPATKTDPKSAKTDPAGATGVKTATVDTPHGRAEVAEVRDPEEAKSFPVSASATARHQAAKAPSAAGEAVIAPGALSEAQVRRELHEEAAAQAQEQTARKRELTPEKGGFSVAGNGTIPIPTDIPEAVQKVIAGGNAIADFPYIWGGGHASFIASGYDCSGSVSYALAAGGLLSQPLVSGELAKWGDPGPGKWITIYANAGHTFMDVDGVWFDTAGRSGPYASRWLVQQPELTGYAVRHPPGF